MAAARFQNNSNIKQPRVNLRKIINDQSRATRIKIPSDRVNRTLKKLSIFNTSYSLNNPIYRSRIIDNDKTEKALISLPVEALNLESTDVNLLNLFGIYKVGDLISMNSSSINRRFGNHIIKRVRQVLGKEQNYSIKLSGNKNIYFQRNCS